MRRSFLFFIFFLLLFSPFVSFSQKETWKWYMSGSPSPALDFSSGAPVALFNSGITFSWEGCGSISDASGNILFYADGHRSVFGKNHVALPNGNGNVFMQNSVTQGGLFISKPGNPNTIYFFYIGLPIFTNSPPWDLYYSEIDLTLNGGIGDINANKNISLPANFGNCSEKMAAVKNCNGADYWLVVHSYTGNSFYSYPVTAAGIGAPVVSTIGTPLVSGAGDDAIGQMKISPNGAKIALVANLSSFAEVFDFNKSTGIVSNPISLGSTGANPYGLEFSPDNSKIYTSNSASPAFIKQWDLCAGSPAAIAASGTGIVNANVYSLQLASDGKIYGSRFTTSIAVIDNPNVAGVGCNYISNGVSVAPGTSSLGLPGFMASYFDSPATSPQATGTQVNSGSCGCIGSATASICAVFGSAPYTYSWSNATTLGPTTALSSTISNLCPGTYSVIVHDAACKSDTLSFTITGGGNSFSVTPTATSSSCGSSNGSASVNISGGTLPYTYLWSPTSQTTSAATGLSAGNYTVLITDNTGCTQTSVINVGSTGGGSVSITSQNISCNGANNGTAQANPTSGTPPYTYLWNNAQSTQTATGLAVGSYTCTVTDVTGCSSSQTVSITQPGAITSSVTVTPSNCGQSTGLAAVAVAGGTSPYTYSWTGGQTTQIATGLSSGNYTCTITDANGCTNSVSAAIANANGPNATISSQSQPGCNGGADGTALASASGGNAPYTFVWNNGQTSQTATGLASAVYTVTVTDAGGCSNTQTVSIAQPTAVTASAVNTSASCGLSDGTATATGGGGTPFYTYSWSNGQTFPTATGLSAGMYSVTITDSHGCTQIATTNIASGNGPTANAGPDVTIQSGSATVLASSGGVTYSWSPTTALNNPSVSNPVASPSVTTTYCVLVSNAGGCSDSACVTVYVELPCGEFYLPSAFSPNNDSENDVFKAYINPDCVKEFKLIIYNRWGENVFETEDVTHAWDGMFHGSMSNSAVYAWYCRAEFTNGNKIDRKGNVSLVR